MPGKSIVLPVKCTVNPVIGTLQAGKCMLISAKCIAFINIGRADINKERAVDR
ncbi:hypothetical protein [Marinifilum fragile]|uniref:hypothetical protein n=1 Tax=Marinifilum fragile TaxID=570161 RepID=UPI0012F91E7D|nr:hypothetical protein [Marinifilum fragile]